MSAIEFETELRGEPALPLPPEVVAQLLKSGRARVLVLVQDDQEDDEWCRASCEQFMKDESREVARGAASAETRRPQTLTDWTTVYDGLSDEQIEAIDKIIRTRANLTRNRS
jgi:hypothetical protein